MEEKNSKGNKKEAKKGIFNKKEKKSESIDKTQDRELVQEYLEGWKRCQAEFENYKRIQSEEKSELVKYAARNIVTQVIPVVDNFTSSVAHIPEDQKDGPWVQGIMYIQKQLDDVLRDNGVEEIEVQAGDEFDANVCEAIEENKKDTDEEKSESGNEIKKVVLKGYRIGEKVIRPARVVVG
ncbi:nucleotide exchange factor GrpE [Patescibacteria group bacterium]